MRKEVTGGRLPVVAVAPELSRNVSQDWNMAGMQSWQIWILDFTMPQKKKKTPHGVTLTHSLSSAAAKRRPCWSNYSRRCVDGRLKDVCPPFSFCSFFYMSCFLSHVLPESRFCSCPCVWSHLTFTPLLLLFSTSFHPPPTVQSYFRTRQPKAPVYSYLFTWTDCTTHIPAEILKVEKKVSGGYFSTHV